MIRRILKSIISFVLTIGDARWIVDEDGCPGILIFGIPIGYHRDDFIVYDDNADHFFRLTQNGELNSRR